MLLELLSARLQLPIGYLQKTARQASHLYKTYSIPKRDGVGQRTIHHPARELKAIQREISSAVLAFLPIHQAAAAYRVGSTLRKHAERHARNRFLMRLDISDFFPSLTREHIHKYVERNKAQFSDWDKQDTDLLCDFSCRQGVLTIGAPTSPAWCNVLCFYLDSALTEYSAARNITYTRYADDMYFSCGDPNVVWGAEGELISLIEQIELPSGLHVNRAKTAHTSLKRRRKVTGLVLTTDGKVSIGRSNKRRVRGMLHRLNTLSLEERHSLAGYLGFCADVEPQFINRLVLRYGSSLLASASHP